MTVALIQQVSRQLDQSIDIVAPQVGSSLVMIISFSSDPGNQVAAISGGGVTWSRGIANFDNAVSPGLSQEIWYGHNSNGTGTTIIITLTSRSGLAELCFSEWSGVPNVAPVPASNNTGTSVNPTTAQISVGTADGLIIAAATFTGNRYVSGPTNSFTRLDGILGDPTDCFQESGYLTGVNPGNHSTDWTINLSELWLTSILAFSPGPTPAQSSAGFWMGG